MGRWHGPLKASNDMRTMLAPRSPTAAAVSNMADSTITVLDTKTGIPEPGSAGGKSSVDLEPSSGSLEDNHVSATTWTKIDLVVLPSVALFYLLSSLVGEILCGFYTTAHCSFPIWCIYRTGPTLEMHGLRAFKRISVCLITRSVIVMFSAR